LVSTATLAWGVNLPAHTVIIKDTKIYNVEQGGFQDIGILDVHQIFGRAGCPQYDSDGHAILLANNKILSRYTTTLVTAQPIDSQFPPRIQDFLNAEIALGTVTTRANAVRWLRYTFWYVRDPDDANHRAQVRNTRSECNRLCDFEVASARDCKLAKFCRMSGAFEEGWARLKENSEIEKRWFGPMGDSSE
jgi:replicative superfamily II helicase